MAPSSTALMRKLQGVFKSKSAASAKTENAEAVPAPAHPTTAADDRSLCMREPEHHDRRYTVVKKLGKGAFGEVYEAQNTSTQELVAIKVLKRHRW